MPDEGQPGDKSSLVLIVSLISAITAGGGGYAFRGADDVPSAEAQDSAKIRALLDREFGDLRRKLDRVQRELDESNKKLGSLRDRVGDVCGPRRRR